MNEKVKSRSAFHIPHGDVEVLWVEEEGDMIVSISENNDPLYTWSFGALSPSVEYVLSNSWYYFLSQVIEGGQVVPGWLSMFPQHDQLNLHFFSVIEELSQSPGDYTNVDEASIALLLQKYLDRATRSAG